MYRVHFYSAGGPQPLLDAGVLQSADLIWMDPPLPDGSVVGCAVALNESVRSILTAVTGVHLLPNYASNRPLSAAALAIVAKYPAYAACKTTADIMTIVFAVNPHPLFDSDA